LRADRHGKIGKPKSKAGHRTVPLGRQIFNALRNWKLQSPKGEHGPVFPTPPGDGIARAFHSGRARGRVNRWLGQN
jgi:hypothetical protein